jgi:hypothetical protein
MAFDIALRDNGSGVFDIKLADDVVGGEVEKSIVFMGLIISQPSGSTETSCVFGE